MTKGGVKRTIDEAFPEFYERGTKAKAIFDVVNPV